MTMSDQIDNSVGHSVDPVFQATAELDDLTKIAVNVRCSLAPKNWFMLLLI